MKKFWIVSLVCTMMLFVGCSRKMDDDMQKDMRDIGRNVEDSGKDMMQDMKESMDDLIDYFKGNKISLNQIEEIENHSLPAHRAIRMDVNGEKAYLYLLKSDDPLTLKIKEKIQKDHILSVKLNDQMMDYAARMNGNFILLYDQNSQVDDVVEGFNKYSKDRIYKNKDTINTPTADGPTGNALTNDQNAGNTYAGNKEPQKTND